MLERWPFSVGYHHEGSRVQLMFSSDACLNLVANPATFRSIEDARSFLQALAAPSSAAVSYAAAAADKGAMNSSKVTSLCSNYRSAPVNSPSDQRCLEHSLTLYMFCLHETIDVSSCLAYMTCSFRHALARVCCCCFRPQNAWRT